MRSTIVVAVCALALAVAIPASALFSLLGTLEGTIDSISEDTLAIISERGATQKMVEIQINEDTQFKEVASLDSLKKGDEVKVKYKEEGEEKIAISVAKVIAEVVPEPSQQL